MPVGVTENRCEDAATLLIIQTTCQEITAANMTIFKVILLVFQNLGLV